MVHLESGERVRARRVIIAIGHEIVPQIPEAFKEFCPPACWPVSVPVPQRTEEHASEHLCNSGHTNCNHQHLHEHHDANDEHENAKEQLKKGKKNPSMSKTQKKKARRAQRDRNDGGPAVDAGRGTTVAERVAERAKKDAEFEAEKKLVVHTSSLTPHW